jgi:MOSC domain-containing protein YiiM
MEHLSKEQLDAGLDHIKEAPFAAGTVELVVSRPNTDERDVLDVGDFVIGEGLVGDNYVARGNSKTSDGAAHPEAQVTIMNSRVIDVITSGTKDMWKMAGDQLLVDYDLSGQNLPAGTQLQIGSAVLEVSAKPHTGCNKFAARFGQPAALWVNSPAGKELNLRGINTMVISGGTVRTGDSISKL